MPAADFLPTDKPMQTKADPARAASDMPMQTGVEGAQACPAAMPLQTEQEAALAAAASKSDQLPSRKAMQPLSGGHATPAMFEDLAASPEVPPLYTSTASRFGPMPRPIDSSEQRGEQVPPAEVNINTKRPEDVAADEVTGLASSTPGSSKPAAVQARQPDATQASANSYSSVKASTDQTQSVAPFGPNALGHAESKQDPVHAPAGNDDVPSASRHQAEKEMPAPSNPRPSEQAAAQMSQPTAMPSSAQAPAGSTASTIEIYPPRIAKPSTSKAASAESADSCAPARSASSIDHPAAGAEGTRLRDQALQHRAAPEGNMASATAEGSFQSADLNSARDQDNGPPGSPLSSLPGFRSSQNESEAERNPTARQVTSQNPPSTDFLAAQAKPASGALNAPSTRPELNTGVGGERMPETRWSNPLSSADLITELTGQGHISAGFASASAEGQTPSPDKPTTAQEQGHAAKDRPRPWWDANPDDNTGSGSPPKISAADFLAEMTGAGSGMSDFGLPAETDQSGFGGPPSRARPVHPAPDSADHHSSMHGQSLPDAAGRHSGPALNELHGQGSQAAYHDHPDPVFDPLAEELRMDAHAASPEQLPYKSLTAEFGRAVQAQASIDVAGSLFDVERVSPIDRRLLEAVARQLGKTSAGFLGDVQQMVHHAALRRAVDGMDIDPGTFVEEMRTLLQGSITGDADGEMDVSPLGSPRSSDDSAADTSYMARRLAKAEANATMQAYQEVLSIDSNEAIPPFVMQQMMRQEQMGTASHHAGPQEGDMDREQLMRHQGRGSLTQQSRALIQQVLAQGASPVDVREAEGSDSDDNEDGWICPPQDGRPDYHVDLSGAFTVRMLCIVM